jgi:uncharacterized cofD-like protein
VVLKAEVAGAEIFGQVNVSAAEAISAVSIVPPDAPVPDEVIAAIEEADQVVLGPGSLFTSVLAVAVVPGVREALHRRSAGRVYVCNLRPQLPETAGFDCARHLRAVLDHDVPVDVMVAPPGNPESIEGVRVVAADLARADGGGHDAERLARVLRALR